MLALLHGRAALVLLSLGIAGCELGNIQHDACKTDTQCAAAFGAGSKCQAGYCGDPAIASGVPTCGPTTGENGREGSSCPPKTATALHNACTGAKCAPFDDKKRLTKLGPDGGLPPLPPPPPPMDAGSDSGSDPDAGLDGGP